MAYAFRLRSTGRGFFALDEDISHDESYAVASVLFRVAFVLAASLAALGYAYRGLLPAMILAFSGGLLFFVVAGAIYVTPDWISARKGSQRHHS